MKNPLIFMSLLFILLNSCRNTESKNQHPAYMNPVIEPLTFAIQEHPEDAELYYQRAEALMEINQDSLSIIDIKKAVDFEPSNPKFLQAFGLLSLRLKQNQEAIRIFQHNLKISPGDVQVRLYLSRAYLAEDKIKKAQSEIQKILNADHQFPEALYYAAQIQIQLKDTIQAIEILKGLNEKNPNFYAASYQLAEWYAATDHESTIDQYKKTFELDTLNVQPLYDIGYFLEEKGNMEAAKKSYIKCLDYDLDFSNAYFKIGEILYKQDSLKKALRHFNLAIKTQIDDAESYYYKGLCFEKLNLKDSARIAFKQALVFDPQLGKAEKSLKNLNN